MKRLSSTVLLLVIAIVIPPAGVWAGAVLPAGESSSAGADTTLAVVVTATRVPTALNEVGSSVTVITRQEIERRGGVTVDRFLEEVPGVQVVRDGGPGQVSKVFLRGAKAEHTLVLVDGVEVNDLSNTGRLFDFSGLAADNIERIEVLRGPQSVLYGSAAMGGVIHVITRRGRGAPRTVATVEGGGLGTLGGGVAASAGGTVNYSLSFDSRATRGVSAAAAWNGNPERDSSRLVTFSTRIGTSAGKADLDLTFRHIRSQADLDGWDFASGKAQDDPNFSTEAREAFFRAKVGLAVSPRWNQSLLLATSDFDRSYLDSTDPANPFDNTSRYQGHQVKVLWQGTVALSAGHRLTTGWEKAWERFQSTFTPEADGWTSGTFLQDQFAAGDLSAAAGLRLDEHDRFGSVVTWRLAPAWKVEAGGAILRASWGTGFRAPTLFQLHDPFFGNPSLAAEKSTGWDTGVEKALADGRVLLGATRFGNVYRDLIDFSGGIYRNTGRAWTRGWETTAEARVPGLKLLASYTRTDSGDPATGEVLPRRARDRYAAGIALTGRRGTLSADLLWVGKRKDRDPSTWALVDLPGYTLAGLAAGARVTPNLELTARVENLLNETYEEVYGYGTPGRSYHLGAKATF